MDKSDKRKLRKLSRQEVAQQAVLVLRCPLHRSLVDLILSSLCWTWTVHRTWSDRDQQHKHFDLRYQSIGARKATGEGRTSGFIHEHVVPRRTLIRLLREIPEPSEEQVLQIFKTFAFAALLTKEEDRLLPTHMPKEFHDPASLHYHDPWLRYRNTPLEIMEISWDGKELGNPLAR